VIVKADAEQGAGILIEIFDWANIGATASLQKCAGERLPAAGTTG
jgi:hypothetical protein